MGKQVNKGNGGVEVQVKPLNNNNVLIEQLRAAILSECYDDMARKQEGCLEFTVRSGQLAINHIVDEKELSPKTIELGMGYKEAKTTVGMSRSGLKTMLMILDSALKEADPIDHATVLVYYSVEENGDYSNGKLAIRRGIHHARY